MENTKLSVELFDYSKAQPSERDQIGKLYQKYFQDEVNVNFDPTLDSDFTDPLKYYDRTVNGSYIVVMERKGTTNTIKGTLGIRAIDIPEEILQGAQHAAYQGTAATPRVCELKRMYLHPDVRGHRLAPRMLQLALEEARCSGFTSMVLDTQRRMTAANRLYEKFGFVECENYNGNFRADRFMVLTL